MRELVAVALRNPDNGIRRVLRFGAIWAAVALSLALSLWGSQWGLFNSWHADELSGVTEKMLAEHTLDPHYSMYGNIVFYGTAVGVAPAMAYTERFDPSPPRSDVPAYAEWQERYHRRIAYWPRIVSAIEGVLLVLVVFLIGSLLFDRAVGLLGAAAFALSPITVYIDHVATADGLANLLFWLACLAAVLSWRRGGRLALALSVFLAGVTTGAKTDHVLVVLLVALAYAWREQKRRSDAVLLLLLPVGYVAANPTLLLNPFAFLDGLTRDMFFGASMDTGATNSWAILVQYLWSDMGWPLGLLTVGGLAYAMRQLVRGEDRRELVWLLVSFVPYCLLTGSKNVSPWYLGQLMPGLLLLGAYAGARVPASWPANYRLLAQGGLGVLYGLALLGPISLDLQFTHDPRDAATRWIEAHARTNATVFLSERGPKLPALRYREETLVPDRERWTEGELPVARLERHPLYQRVRHAILAAERRSGDVLHTPVRDQPYRGWYDEVLAELEVRPNATARVMQVHPDFVVVVRGMSPALLAWLREPGSGYAEVASFTYRSPVRPGLRMPMVNQPVWVFQRRPFASESQPR